MIERNNLLRLRTNLKDPVLRISFILSIISFLVPIFDNKDYKSVLVEVKDSIDFKTLILLFCLMISIQGLESLKFFRYIGARLLKLINSTRKFYLYFVLSCFFISAIITNDVSLIVFVPFALILAKNIGLENDFLIKLVVSMTLAANLGSSFTSLGNPQNLYIFSKYNLNFFDISIIYFPYWLVSLFLFLLSSIFIKEKVLDNSIVKYEKLNISKLVIYFTLIAICLICLFGFLDYKLLFCLIVLIMFFADKSLFFKVDYSLLLTFFFIFIFIANIKNMDVINALSIHIKENVFISSIVFSQFISNVPASIFISNFTNDYRELILGTNIGGLGTIIASMASLISYKFFIGFVPNEKVKYFKIFTYANIGLLIFFIAMKIIIK